MLLEWYLLLKNTAAQFSIDVETLEFFEFACSWEQLFGGILIELSEYYYTNLLRYEEGTSALSLAIIFRVEMHSFIT